MWSKTPVKGGPMDSEKSFELYELIAKNTGDVISVWNTDLKAIYVSPSVERQMGYTPEEIKRLRLEDIVDEEGIKKVLSAYEEEMAREREGKADRNRIRVLLLRHRRKDGRAVWMEVSVSAIRDLKGEIRYFLAVSRNIDVRVKTLEALRHFEERFRTVFNSVGEGIFILDKNSETIIEVNRRAVEMYGYGSKKEVVREEIDVLTEVLSRKREICDKGEICFHFFSSPPTGKGVWVEVEAREIRVGKREKIMVVVRDITMIKEVQEDLSREKEMLMATLQNIGEGIIRVDTQGKIVLMNRSAEELTGWSREEAEGKHISHILHLKDSREGFVEDMMKRALISLSRVDVPLYCGLVSRRGTLRVVSLSVSPILHEGSETCGAIFIIRDVSERERFLRAVQNSQKLEALGTLAAGIAHDFNNLLSGIYGYINLAIIKDEVEAMRGYLEKSLASIERARSLTHQLLTFAKGGVPVKKVLSIQEFLERTVSFALSGSCVSPVFELSPNLWPCSFDPNQMAQVIDNIVLNAIDAMPGGGNIFIGAENVVLDTDMGALQKGRYVKITIRDRGEGMPPEVLSRIFEPFYTTKEKGNGLGLSISYSIVKRHGGEILVDSSVGEGSVFYIYLPAAEREIEEEGTREEEIHQGHGLVLVLEDDEVLAEVLGEMLSTMGYEVKTFTRGEEILEYLSRCKGKGVRAMFFDLTISGGMGGVETMREVRRCVGDGIVTFVMSGYSSDSVMANPSQYGFTASLKKPFKFTDLVSLLNRYLSPPSPSPIA